MSGDFGYRVMRAEISVWCEHAGVEFEIVKGLGLLFPGSRAGKSVFVFAEASHREFPQQEQSHKKFRAVKLMRREISLL